MTADGQATRFLFSSAVIDRRYNCTVARSATATTGTGNLPQRILKDLGASSEAFGWPGNATRACVVRVAAGHRRQSSIPLRTIRQYIFLLPPARFARPDNAG